MSSILDNANNPPQTYNCGRATPCLTGEILPSISRTMNFQVTVRDNRSGMGAINSDTVAVNVVGTAGPFVVSAPNGGERYNPNSMQTVAWSVASTDVAPISVANINILLSIDGGNTFPMVLAANTPNDGSEMVTMPNLTNANARIRVEAAPTALVGANGTFFDVSNANFRIGAPSAASAPLGGRITDAYGRALRGVRVRLSNADGTLDLTATTNIKGFYSFSGVLTGTDYIVSATRKGYRFTPDSRLVNHFNEDFGLDFRAVSE